jgi:hypothetical protein
MTSPMRRVLAIQQVLDAFAAAGDSDLRPCPRCCRQLWQCNCEMVCVSCGQELTREEAATSIEPLCFGCSSPPA